MPKTDKRDIEFFINIPLQIDYIQNIEKAIDKALSPLGFSRQVTTKSSPEDQDGFHAKLEYQSFF